MTFQSLLLSLIIFLPIIGGIAILFLPADRLRTIWLTALGLAAVNLVLTVLATLFYLQSRIGIASANPMAVSVPWIPGLGINYSLDIDGISSLLILLTALLTVICIAASFRVERKVKNYMAFMLLFSGGMLGVFLAANLFLFYIFWEVMLIPAYFLVGSWGGERRISAAIKFVLYTSVGSLLMLAGVIAMGVLAGSLEISTLLQGGKLSGDVQLWVLLAFVAAFIVKVPFVPFHSWLPDAYSEAPTPVTALLSGAMAKTGAYGFLRICIPLFPEAIKIVAPYLSWLAVASILYCAVLALVQTDMKRLLAYSSISHLGVVMLGMFAFNVQGIEGSVMQMVNHGITVAALFLIAGFIEERTGTRNMREFGGLASRLPVLATVMFIASLSSLGLPGLNSFAGEFLALLGAFRQNVPLGILGTLVVIPAAWYMLRFFQGMMTGPRPTLGHVAVALRRGVSDLRMNEFLVLLPLLILIFYIGLYPLPLTSILEPSVVKTLEALGSELIK